MAATKTTAMKMLAVIALAMVGSTACSSDKGGAHGAGSGEATTRTRPRDPAAPPPPSPEERRVLEDEIAAYRAELEAKRAEVKKLAGELAAATTDEARAEARRRIALVRKSQAAVQYQIDQRTSRLTPP
ncbi:MAG: hypothetical protein KBG48_09915 [Kofleriaceae bacterium]|nr:hypothetical protein [Kofleriaceae bacterium]MBP9167694.1 hypothetical protein [Kofleriaceae bacterium]MBP9859268.1 hypothetical protein [Kofleriaceae bacterium]